MLIVDLF